MPDFDLHYDRGGVRVEGLDLWLDPPRRQRGPERVFVSHAHSDHVASHREVILTRATALLMKARGTRPPIQHELTWGEVREFRAQDGPWRITLLPAGHILGSAMGWIEREGRSLLYTGDFKLRAGLAAEPCQPRHADVLVMETTFGQPRYRFPPASEVLGGILRFCHQALDNHETPVLLCYALGKSQEVLLGLMDAGLSVALHERVCRMTRIYEQLGYTFPPYHSLQTASPDHRQVIICPPFADRASVLQKFEPIRTAALTGWAVDPGYCYQQRCEAAFPLSDHADFDELLEMVRLVQPARVFTLHGFAGDFAATLRELGWNAQALSEPEQLNLVLPGMTPQSLRQPKEPLPRDVGHSPSETRSADPRSFLCFAAVARDIGLMSNKQGKVQKLADYLRELDDRDLECVARWISGRLLAHRRHRDLRVGWALLRDALCEVSGHAPAEVRAIYLKHNEVGATTEEVLTDFSRPSAITIADLYAHLERLALTQDPHSRRSLVAAAIRECSPAEAAVLTRALSGDLRIGLPASSVEEALALAFGQPDHLVQRAYALRGDLGEVALITRHGGLADLDPVPFRPLKFSPGQSQTTRHPVPEAHVGSNELACQVHCVDGRVALYTDDLEEVSTLFPELAEALRAWRVNVILSGVVVESLPQDLPPQDLLLNRRQCAKGDWFATRTPVLLRILDLWWLNGRTLLDQPIETRLQVLQSVESRPDCLQ